MNRFLKISLMSIILFTSCKQNSEVKEEITKPDVPFFTKHAVRKVEKFPHKLTKEGRFYSIPNSMVKEYIDSTIIDENRRLFATMDSLNDLMTLRGGYGSLNTTYDEFYWYEENNEYICTGSKYRRNRLFLHWPKFNILSYAKEDMDRDIFTSPLYLASHDKNTGEMIDRVSFDFYGLYDGMEKGTSSLTVYTDSIVGVINHKKSTYLISPEGKLTLK